MPVASAAPSPPEEPPDRALGVVRVARGAVDEVVGVVVERELGDVGLAEQDRARAAQVARHGRVLGRDVALEDLRPVAAGHPGDLDALLGGERHAVQRPDALAVDRALLGRARLLERLLDSAAAPRVELAVDLLGPPSMWAWTSSTGLTLASRTARAICRRRPSQQLLHRASSQARQPRASVTLME